MDRIFTSIAARIAGWAGQPIAFILALGTIILWGTTGPLFGYSDTWQLVINTSTTIITFLMVFLIQHTQNRDTLALQIKVAELILTMHGAKSDLAVAEDLSEESLERIHEKFKKSAKGPQRRRQRQKRKTKSTKEPPAS